MPRGSNMTSRVVVALALLVACGPAIAADLPVGPAKELIVYPKEVKLSGPRDEQRLVVLGVWPDGRKLDLTRSATYTSASDGTVIIDKSGIVRPAADGSTSVTIEAAGVKASVSVTVEKTTADVPVNFTREIEPILTKAGCNGGGCHGAQHGKGGFRLSLFAFDPESDYAQIVQSNEGRRVVVNDPERSILLAKPSLVMEHGGGERLKLGGRDYTRIKQWLADGAPQPNEKTDPVVAKIDVFPPSRS